MMSMPPGYINMPSNFCEQLCRTALIQSNSIVLTQNFKVCAYFVVFVSLKLLKTVLKHIKSTSGFGESVPYT